MIALAGWILFFCICWRLIRLFGFTRFYLALWIVGGFFALFGSVLFPGV